MNGYSMRRPLRSETTKDPVARDLWSLGVVPALALGSLLGVLGVYWDIAWHVDLGRDSFFSPPHLLVYSSLFSVLVMGLYALIRDRRSTPYHLPLGRWRLHPGALVVALGALVVLLSAPLDDLWHRLFGPDATLWGPMHLALFAGAVLGCIGGLVCTAVERRLAASPERRRLFDGMTLLYGTLLLAWLVLLVGEYEFNVSFFLTFFHPVLLAGAPSFALVLVARLSPYPWGATTAALGFTLLRLLLAAGLMGTASLGMGGYTRPLIPVLVLSAVAVDLLLRKGLPAWLAGAAAGLATLLVNALLISVLDANPWTPRVLAQALLPALLLAAAAGAAGAWVAAALSPPRRQRRASEAPGVEQEVEGQAVGQATTRSRREVTA